MPAAASTTPKPRDYVTLEDIAGFIRAGREVQIVDLKSGDDLTRQYLLQIVAEHECKGENVLPINVLTDLVRSYTTDVQSDRAAVPCHRRSRCCATASPR